MKASEAPAFLKVEHRTIIRKAPKFTGKTARKRGAGSVLRVEGDTGTKEMKQRQVVLLEVRDRSSTGHPISVGARVEAQFPHDRYKVRKELDPSNEWRNLMLWQAAERFRQDFDASGIAPRVCSSFVPRVSGSRQNHSDMQMDAEKRYKKAMNAVGQSLRPILFYVCLAGESANDWARRNAMIPQAGLSVLRLALAELAHHYGLAKLPNDRPAEKNEEVKIHIDAASR
jgi:hypothetical protein